MARPNTGTIYYEKERKKYKVLITDPSGARHTKRFNTEQEAVTYRLTLLSKFMAGDFINRTDVTLGEWVLQYLNIFVKPKVRAKTFNDYLAVVAHLDDCIADKQIQKLTPMDAQWYLSELKASAHVKQHLKKLLSRASKKACLIGLIAKDFMVGVETPAPKPKPVEIFTVEELHKILDAIAEADDERVRRHYLFVSLAIASGCRMGEMLALTPEDIEDDAININKGLVEVNSTPTIQPPKTPAGFRRVTLPKSIMDMLRQAAMCVKPKDFIFKNANGKPCRTTNIDKSWKVILKAADVPYRKFHCLRHTHATMMLAAGVPILEVAKRLGHSRASHTLNLYGHAVPGYDKKMPKVVESVFRLDNNLCPSLPTTY